MFALPLLIYKLTGSALNLGLSMAVGMLPYLLFGLVIGAWVDRLDRKRLMIGVNFALACLMASIPVIAYAGHLSIAYIYAVEFSGSTLGIFFNSAEFAAIPSLVGKDNLVTANGRIQASYSAVTVAGPVLAGIMVSFVPLQTVLFVDAGSYLIASVTLLTVRGSFNVETKKAITSIRNDVVAGLRYVLSHPVLRNISLMMAMVNFVGATVNAQIVLFAKRELSASNTQIGWLFAAEGVGVVVLSLAAGPLRKRWSFSVVALSALASSGVAIVALSFTRSVYAALPLIALMSGLGILFNINTGSLRQQIVPNDMLGRVISIAGVLAWSAIPLGSTLGGVIIQTSGNVVLVFAVIGFLTIAIPLGFSMTPLGHADRYVDETTTTDTSGGDERTVGAEAATTLS